MEREGIKGREGRCAAWAVPATCLRILLFVAGPGIWRDLAGVMGGALGHERCVERGGEGD